MVPWSSLTDLERFPLPGVPQSMSHRQIFDDEDREKRNDAKSIYRMNTTVLDWFRPSHGVTTLCPVFVVLC
jgi:hypothetical protein